MSLFKARDWWSVQCGGDESFDQNSLCVANIDNANNSADKVIVGSQNGILRVFSINTNTNSPADDGNLATSGFQPGDLLLEMNLKLPILQVASGQFLSATDKNHLALLHPRKLSVYSISASAGVTEHGSSYNILLIYEHHLQRSAYNLVTGTFGQVKGSSREFLCVQSLDGTLSFYEQESFAFSRFLPNFLLPGPIVYVPNNDSFIVATSSWAIESYRYQVLAIAKEGGEDKTQNQTHLLQSQPQSQSQSQSQQSRGRKVTADWSVALGEAALELKSIILEKNLSYIIVLGERNLYVLKDNGIIWFMKKFDFSPSCMFAYPSHSNDSIMTLIATHQHTLLIHCNDILKWAAQLPFKPISIARANISNTLQGAIVALSDEGQLCCCYLGTNPSINIVPVPMSSSHLNQINNYEEAEQELQELRKIINTFNNDPSANADLSVGGSATTQKRSQTSSDLTISIGNIQIINSTSAASNHLNKTSQDAPIITLSIKLEASVTINNVRLMVDVSTAFTATPNILTYPSIGINLNTSPISEIAIEQRSSPLLPSSTKLTTVVAYTTNQGAPRVVSKSIHLPLSLVAKVTTPIKESEHKIILDAICHQSLNVNELFSDLLIDPSIGSNSNNSSAIGIELLGDNNSIVTVISNAKSELRRFRIQSDSFAGMVFISNELIRRLQCNDVKFDASGLDKTYIPLEEYFTLIDQHLKARCRMIDLQSQLSNTATEFRAIQKRLLIKLKDRNPTPLNNLDTLLEMTHSQILKLGDDLIRATQDLDKISASLACATQFICHLLSIATNMKPETYATLRAILSSNVSSDIDEGWEERVEVALVNQLQNHLRGDKELAKYSNFELSIPENTNNIRRFITVLVDRIFAGDAFDKRAPPTTESQNKDTQQQRQSQNIKATFTSPTTEVIPEEDEDSGFHDHNKFRSHLMLSNNNNAAIPNI